MHRSSYLDRMTLPDCLTCACQVGGPIGLVRDGDEITIDADTLTISVAISDAVMEERRAAWVAPPFKYTRGTMYRYIKTVSSAQKGCVTDE